MSEIALAATFTLFLGPARPSDGFEGFVRKRTNSYL